MNLQHASIALLAMAALVACAPADDEAAAKTGDPVEEPLELDLSFVTTDMHLATDSGARQVTFDDRCSVPSDWVIRMDLTGTDSTLGPVTGEAEHCSQVRRWRDTEQGPAPDSVTYGDGRGFLVTAAGDTLRFEYADGVGAVNAETGVMWFRDRLTVTGGTGSLAGVTGHAEEEGSLTDLNAPASMRTSGTLRRPGG